MFAPVSVEPPALNEPIKGWEVLAVKEAEGTLATVTCCDVVAVLPDLSVTVSVTVYVPACEYVWVGFTPLPGAEPSPKSQLYESIVPAVSFDPEPSKWT